MFVIKYRKIFFIFSGLLVITSLALIFIRGLNIGIDFTGGSEFEIKYETNRPEISEARQIIQAANIEGAEKLSIRPIGENGFYFQMQSTASTTHQVIFNALEQAALITMPQKTSTTTLQNASTTNILTETELSLEQPVLVTAPQNASTTTLQGASVTNTNMLTKTEPSIIGPSAGAELSSKAWVAIIIVVFAIILFIAYAFRHASEKVSSWNYGIVAIIALIHDIIIPTGVVALLGLEVTSLFVIALLAILGLSVNDTIVVFDRVRENVKFKVVRNFSEIVGKSLQQTFVRSINTSLTTLFVLLALFFVGPENTKDFALVLVIGLIAGTYSSIFLASPLLVEIGKKQGK
ncbi:protein translocase subunit SecF [Patescibacteria group bacterium]|nr:protein translocase subunit SecF [Patescibacteria group bacterium]MBU1730140.1 protein translocase subunit SecF [Patescibacteria group bacterium]MBU1956110.1 protein translocase subunit SecF [Patescibacteria group bacterium]